MKILPDRPNLEFLRREAQTLKSRHRARDASVCDAIGHFDTSMHGLSHDVHKRCSKSNGTTILLC